MRPQTAFRIVNKTMKYYYSQRESTDISKLTNKQFIQALDHLLIKSIKDDRKTYKELDLEYKEPDTYYSDCISNPENIMSHLFYISDRWNCTGRIKFLILISDYFANNYETTNR